MRVDVAVDAREGFSSFSFKKEKEAKRKLDLKSAARGDARRPDGLCR